MIRLSESLKGDARDATRALFIAGSSVDCILRTLEMRFGDPGLIIDHIVEEIKGLPRIVSCKSNLVDVATRLKNCISAIRSLKNSIGYLYSKDLTDEILGKMPNSMINGFVRYAAFEGKQEPDLVKLTNFLFEEAEIILAAGVIRPRQSKASVKGVERSSKNSNNCKSVFLTSTSESPRVECNESNQRCAHCERNNHCVNVCRDFAKASLAERWRTVKSNRLCFNCLGDDHVKRDCKKDVCE